MTDLFHVVEGDGPTVMAMHGGLGLDHTYLKGWLDGMARVVYYDHRGNGRSPRPDDWSTVTHESMVADAEALRAAVGAERMTIFGQSYGAFIALEYALRHPERVAGLILVGAAPALQHLGQSMAIAQARLSPDDFARVVEDFSTPADDEMVAREWPWLQRLYLKRYDQGLVERLWGHTIYSAAALNHSLGVMAPTYDVRGRLGEIEAPTLIVTGKWDWITPPELGAEPLHAGIRGSRLEIFEESGHFPFAEEPERFRAAVRKLIG